MRGLRARRRRCCAAASTRSSGQRGGEVNRFAFVGSSGIITPRGYSRGAARRRSRRSRRRICANLWRRFSDANGRRVRQVKTGVLRAQSTAAGDDLGSVYLGGNLSDGTIQIARRTDFGCHLHRGAPRKPKQEHRHRHLHCGAFSNERATRDSWAGTPGRTEIRPVSPRRHRRGLGLGSSKAQRASSKRSAAGLDRAS